MYSFALIAMTKQGKSRTAREMITGEFANYPCIVNDVNNEYGAIRRDRETGAALPGIGLPDNVDLPRSRYIGGDINEYLSIVENKRYTTVIFEEATAFFKGRTSERLCKLVINKGHTYNNYVFLFHSIRSVPPELLGFMDFIYLFKTGDTEKVVADKAPGLLPYWLIQKTKPSGAKPIKIDWLNENFDENLYAKLKAKVHAKR